MERSADKHWAARYLLDPLNAPEPSQETGPGTSFRQDPLPPRPSSSPATTASPPNSPNKLSRKLFQKISTPPKSPIVAASDISRRSRPNSPIPPIPSSPSPSSASTGSPSRDQLAQSHRQEAFGRSPSTKTGRQRGSSLTQRFPGDTSHRPLETLTREKALADRSRHVTEKHHIIPDTIDNLDTVTGGAYHHSGPYDAALFARNNSDASAPLLAVADSNAEALKATPREKIVDSLERHRPLDGVAMYSPGETDLSGHVYDYEPGENMMIEGGNAPGGGAYKRWPGLQYHPDDIKGKGEPSYSIEKAIKEHKTHKRENAGEGIEMTNQDRGTPTGADSPETKAIRGTGVDSGAIGRSESVSKRLSGGGLMKRIGSIKKHLHRDD